MDGSPDPSRHSLQDNRRLAVAAMGLANTPGIGFRTLLALDEINVIGDLFARSSEDLVALLSGQGSRFTEAVIKSLVEKRDTIAERGEAAVRDLESRRITFVHRTSPEFPPALRRLSDSPRWLFVAGNIGAIESDAIVAVVGSREPTDQGRKVAARCGGALAERDIVVLSGMARGIDETAHIGCLSVYGQTVAILGHGLLHQRSTLADRIVELDGAVLSEYLPEDPPSSQRFLRRNELIAALARAMIPVEVRSSQSGTAAAIRRAIKLETPVVGISLKGDDSPESALSRRVLGEMGISIYPIANGSPEFWRALSIAMPDHQFAQSSARRRERFLRLEERRILEAATSVGLDDSSIDEFAYSLKSKLGHPPTQS